MHDVTQPAVKTFTILGFDYALATAITGVIDLLSMAGVTWNMLNQMPMTPYFRVEIATRDGGPFRCLNNLILHAHRRIDEIEETDLLLVPTIAGNIDKTLSYNPEIIDCLRRHHAKGTLIASNCTGAFFLAEAGILDGKPATTHWGFIDRFRERYPRVDLKPEQMITNADTIFCSGGGNAWFDLSLYLIERFCGHEVAVGCAKSFVIDMGRESQLTYSTLKGRKYHRDEAILTAQNWLEESFREPVNIESLALRTGMSPRNFIRRFKKATGETPLNYLQALRLEAAKKLLEETNQTVEEITLGVGYEDISSFTKLFCRRTGLTPRQYRRKFQRRQAS